VQYRSTLLACGTAALMVCAAAQAATLSKADKEFMNTVATMDMTGAHQGQLAENRAAKPEVKDFARMLVKDESESYGHLEQVAARTGATIPRGINTGHIPEIRSLENLNGARFDQTFTRNQVSDQQRALAVFKREAKYGENSDVKAYANSMIPVLDNDLKRAQQCAAAK